LLINKYSSCLCLVMLCDKSTIRKFVTKSFCGIFVFVFLVFCDLLIFVLFSALLSIIEVFCIALEHLESVIEEFIIWVSFVVRN
jgi:hypothetical protein